jgi:phosphatidylglycerophosphate synthase
MSQLARLPIGHLRTERRGARRVAATATVARLSLVPVIAVTFLHEPAITALALAIFIVADVYDGALAQRAGVEDFQRRVLDSTVDRIAIDACLVAAWAAGALPLALLVLFLVRDAYCAAICAPLVRRRVVPKADWMYRGLNLSVAGWALAAPALGQGARSALAALVFVASLAVAGDLTRAVRRILRSGLERGTVISLTAVRRGDLDATGAAAR